MDIDYNILLSNENFINQLEENYNNNINNENNKVEYSYLPSITEENKPSNKNKLPSLNPKRERKKSKSKVPKENFYFEIGSPLRDKENKYQNADYNTNGDNNYFIDLGNLNYQQKNIKNNINYIDEKNINSNNAYANGNNANANLSFKRNKILKPINAFNK